MSLGSHILTRGSISRSIQGDLLAAPRDHIAFLYPLRWSSKSRTSVANGHRASPQHPNRKAPSTRGRNAGFNIETTAQWRETLPLTIRNNERQRSFTVAQGDLRTAPSGTSARNDPFLRQSTKSLPYGHSVYFQKRRYSLTTASRNGAVAHIPNATTAQSDSANDGPIVMDDHVTISPQRRPLVRIVRVAKSRQKHLADKASVNLYVKDKTILSFDWRVPLNHLKEHTQPFECYSDQDGERVLVHRDVIPFFAGNVRETLWDINLRSGCEVHVLGEEEAVGVYRVVLLRGLPSAIEMAKEVMSELFYQVSPAVKVSDSSMILSGAAAMAYEAGDPSLVPRPRAKIRRLRQIRVDDIPRPEVWNRLSFAKYVEDLIRSTVSRSMQRHLYEDEKPHVVMVRRKLVELFKNARYDEHISGRAFNDALRFLSKHNMISTLRTLFVRMEHLRLRMLPETFNIMLHSAAAQKDLHNYTLLLKLMIRRRHRPNASSWVALLMAVPSRAVQIRIESRMREKGLLQIPAAAKEITALILSDELIGHLDSGQDMPSFIGRIDAVYGPDWMSPSSLNRALDVIGERGSYQQASDTIELFLNRGIWPNTVSLNTLLSHCQRQGNVNEAIRMMQYIHSQFKVRADEVTFHNLFMLAWKSQQYNTCRVVWRHACMQAAVSYKMQELILRSLLRNTPSQPKTKREIWAVSAAKVIAGVASEPGIVAKLIGWSETGQQREENLAIAKEVLAQDLSAVLKHRPAHPLAQQLAEAFALDRVWAHNESWKGASARWKIENAIDVALIPHT